MNKISVVIIAKNPENTLEMCLDSLIRFDEVILYINDTTDNTKYIASKFENVKVIDGEFDGFGPTKNAAATYAKNDWILSLDSDEVLTESLVDELLTCTLGHTSIYSLLRINFYKTTQIRYCWGDDVLIRLYNRTKTQFTDKKVHEKIIEEGCAKVVLKNTFFHYPYHSITDFIIKADRYSTLFANDNAGKKSSSPTKAILNGIFSFVKTYFFKRGFLDGYAGLVIAFSHMATNFYKYIKLYEQNLELKK